MLRLRRNLNDWEMGELYRLLGSLEGIYPDASLEDGWEWSSSKKGSFTSKSLYLEMVGYRYKSFPFCGSWNLGIPSKVYLFLWMLFLVKFLPLTFCRVEVEIWLTDVFCA